MRCAVCLATRHSPSTQRPPLATNTPPPESHSPSQGLEPPLGRLGPPLARPPPRRTEVGRSHVVLRDGHGRVQIHHAVPPAAGHEDGLARLLHHVERRGVRPLQGLQATKAAAEAWRFTVKTCRMTCHHTCHCHSQSPWSLGTLPGTTCSLPSPSLLGPGPHGARPGDRAPTACGPRAGRSRRGCCRARGECSLHRHWEDGASSTAFITHPSAATLPPALTREGPRACRRQSGAVQSRSTCMGAGASPPRTCDGQPRHCRHDYALILSTCYHVCPSLTSAGLPGRALGRRSLEPARVSPHARQTSPRRCREESRRGCAAETAEDAVERHPPITVSSITAPWPDRQRTLGCWRKS